MANGDRIEAVKSVVQKFGLPTAAGAVGVGAGLVLTRKPNKGGSSLPDMKGVGDLFDDLRGKLDSVIGSGGSSSRRNGASGRSSSSGSARGRSAQRSLDEIANRRKERAQRRGKRRSGSSR